MAERILITSGPTREPLDPVRFLSNASSGRMGVALAEAVLEAGFQVTIVSGPVQVRYPTAAMVVPVVTTQEMLHATAGVFAGTDCIGVIGAAAPCDFRPVSVAVHKIRKNRHGTPVTLELVETPDILANLGAMKRPDQRIVGFALESESHEGAGLAHAVEKLRRKRCELLVLNAPSSIGADRMDATLIGEDGTVWRKISGTKRQVADTVVRQVFGTTETQRIFPESAGGEP
ncbi:MAG: phosphopantothenoylcysteine decarboxylase [Planctomycetia bacterium]|nr:phosphopantothenoylcysteine decarboxylase [Planctomycetia bacterium]